MLKCKLFGHKIVWLLEIEGGEGLTHYYGECSRCSTAFGRVKVVLTSGQEEANHELLNSLLEQQV